MLVILVFRSFYYPARPTESDHPFSEYGEWIATASSTLAIIALQHMLSYGEIQIIAAYVPMWLWKDFVLFISQRC